MEIIDNRPMQVAPITGRSRSRGARSAALGLLLAVGAGCSDPAAPDGSTAVVRFSIGGATAQVSAVRVQVNYRRGGGQNQPLLDARFEISANQQSVAVEIDIAACLADAEHVGAENECTVDADVSLLDANDAVLDEKQVGPFVLTGGSSTTAPPVTFDVLVASVAVTPASVSVLVAGLVQLNAEPRSANGTALTGRTVTWASSDVSVASVSATGLVTGVAPGSVTITAISEGVDGTATVTVLASSPGGNVLVPGDLRAGTISAAAETHTYTFNGQNGDVVLITLAQTAGFNAGFGILARATVLAPNGTQLVRFNANGQRTLTLNQTGTFTIHVDANNLTSTGNYSIGLERLSPLGPIDANLAPGDVVASTISAAAEVDIYTFAGQSGDRVLVTLGQTGGFNSGFGILARATVIAPSGAQLDQFNANGQRTLALTESGTFIIRIDANNVVNTGSYGVGFERLNPVGAVDANLAPGDVVASTISAAAEVDIYTFAGQTGDQVLVTLGQTGGFNSGFGILARATVIAPSGTQVDQFNASGQRILTLTESGTFIIRVDANNVVNTGSYGLGLERLRPSGPVEGALVSGAPVSGSIGAAAEVDVYTFSGQSGATVLLTLTQTGGFNPGFGILARAGVVAPSGVQLVQFNATGQRTLSLTETGVYTVYISANNFVSTGTYSVSIQ